MTTATKPTPIVSMLGGQYPAECGPDGKYSLKNIEFFSTHKKGENGIEFDANDEWITAAYKGLVELAPKTLLPVNVFHHGDPQHPDVRQIGYFMPRDLKKTFVNGRDRLTIFGDIIGVDSYDFGAIRNVKLPFRSAQVLSFKNKRFSALSLLKDQVGYYEYPMTTVGSVTFSGSAPDLPTQNESPMMAYRATSEDGDSGAALYAFGGNDKKKKKPDDKKKSDGKPGGDDKSKKPGEGGEDPKDGEDDEQDAAVDGEESDQPESMTDGMSSDEKIDKIFAMVAQLLKDSVPSEDEVNGNKAPSQDRRASKKTYSAKEDAVSKETEVKKEAAPAAVVTPDAKATEAKTATQDDAKYSALEDRTEKLEKKISSKENAEKAIAALEAEGFNLTSKTKGKIETYSAKGEDSLKDFVDTYRTYADKDPSETVDGGTTGAPSGASVASKSSLPADVADYAAKNPTDKGGISLRAKLFPEYQVYKDQGGTIPSFERFVQAEVAAEGTRMKVEPE
jgi:hypothetical protein